MNQHLKAEKKLTWGSWAEGRDTPSRWFYVPQVQTAGILSISPTVTTELRFLPPDNLVCKYTVALSD